MIENLEQAIEVFTSEDNYLSVGELAWMASQLIDEMTKLKEELGQYKELADKAHYVYCGYIGPKTPAGVMLDHVKGCKKSPLGQAMRDVVDLNDTLVRRVLKVQRWHEQDKQYWCHDDLHTMKEWCRHDHGDWVKHEDVLAALASPTMPAEHVNRQQHWCMCTLLKSVARDGFSTCSICGGKDAYGKATSRPADKKKVII